MSIYIESNVNRVDAVQYNAHRRSVEGWLAGQPLAADVYVWNEDNPNQLLVGGEPVPVGSFMVVKTIPPAEPYRTTERGSMPNVPTYELVIIPEEEFRAKYQPVLGA